MRENLPIIKWRTNWGDLNKGKGDLLKTFKQSSYKRTKKERASHLEWKSVFNRKNGRVLLSGEPIAIHCHHYNINLQKMLEDTMGDKGVDLMYRSAEKAAYQGFREILDQFDQIHTKKSKMEFVASLCQNCGLGIFHFRHLEEDSGKLISPSSHHVTGWLAKHGKRDTPGCHFSRGWIAGVLAAVYEHPPGFFRVEEKTCKMMLDDVCEFVIMRNQ